MIRPLIRLCSIAISIHALVKRATIPTHATFVSYSISIHALVKRATLFHCLYYNVPLYFNPRPRKEGDNIFRIKYCQMTISIHALVKRATKRVIPSERKFAISIHALVKRATKLFKPPTLSPVYFNPRPRKEGDTYKIYTSCITLSFQSTPS